MQILYLSIAGCIIRLVFYRSLDKQNKVTPKQFIKEILKHNEGFIVEKKPSRTDYTIEFLEVKGMNLLHDKNQNTYLHFLSYVGPHHIATYSYISRVQFIFLLKQAIQEVLGNRGFVLHCSAILVNGKAVLFLGESGAGKTTIANMLKRQFPILADDEGYIRIDDNSAFFYQGPFLERAYSFKKSSNQYEIGRVFLVSQAKKCDIVQLSLEEFERKVRKQIVTSNVHKVLPSFKNMLFSKLKFNKNKEELMNCVLDHTPFNDPSGLDTK